MGCDRCRKRESKTVVVTAAKDEGRAGEGGFGGACPRGGGAGIERGRGSRPYFPASSATTLSSPATTRLSLS